KLFEGTDLKTENLTNFVVSVNTETKIVTLTANEGFTIGNQPKLDSTAYTLETLPTVTDLAITAKGTTALNGNQIIDLTSSTASLQLASLQLLFEGNDLTEANLVNFEVSINATNVVTLTAKTNFTISSQAKLDSAAYTVTNINLNITANAVQQLTIAEDTTINAPSTSANAAEQLVILQKLFKDITDTNINYFTFSIKDKVVTLKAKQGFAFGAAGVTGTDVLAAPAYTVEVELGISANPNSIALTGVELIDLEGTNAPKQLAVLIKLFNGVDSTNQTNFTITISGNVVTLTANTGFTFNGNKILNSIAYTVTNINLDIEAETAPQTLSKEQEVLLMSPTT
ncbi:MAG: hypothetical protein ACRDAW_01410, partial [Metamycoplasmataceae bacterium]